MSFSVASGNAPASYNGSIPQPVNGARLPVLHMIRPVPRHLQECRTFFCPTNGYWMVAQVSRVTRPMDRSNVAVNFKERGDWNTVKQRKAWREVRVLMKPKQGSK